MEDFFFDLLAALAVIVNGLPQGLLALSFGFAARATALGFALGAIGALSLGVVSPISYQAETITLAGRLGNDRRERISIVVLAGAVMVLIGGLGLLEQIVAFIGPSIQEGMMAGVGVILAWVAVNMVRQNPTVGLVSLAVAFPVQAYTGDLVYTVVLSVVAATIVALVGGYQGQQPDLQAEKLKPHRLSLVNLRVLRGAASVIMLTIGANIAFGGITGDIADTPVNFDHLTVISGGANVVSGIFGGAPVEAIISATGAAPDPLRSGVLMMALFAVLLLAGLLPKMARYVPSASIAGFLFVLGAVVTFPGHIQEAVAADPVVGGVTAVATAVTDPFIGMVVGLITRALMGLGVGF